MTSNSERSHLAARLDLLATVLLIIVSLVVVSITAWDRLKPVPGRGAREEPPAPVPTEPVSTEGAQIIGDRMAKIALILFSEFQCPYCARSSRDVLPEIDRQYIQSGKVLLVWRHYPLSIHENAQKAAEASECAGRQGKFRAFHDWAFAHQNELDPASLRLAAKTLGLDPTRFEACLEGEATAIVQADLKLGDALSVSGTPAWFIGVIQPDGRVKITDRLNGAKPFPIFRQILDRVIATVEGSD